MLAYLSLGANLGDREGQLREALARLGTVAGVFSIPSLYETEPVEMTDQPWFVNCAVALETDRTPNELMIELLNIEKEMGRRRVQKKGPRNIDLDILLLENEVIESPGLTIPHPAMQRRRFVLEPLAEIAPEARHPVLNQSVRELLEELSAGPTVRKI